MRTCKVFYTLALAAAGVTALAADTVTLSVSARPVGEVLAEVSRQTGIKLEAGNSVRGIPLFIEVKDMPTKVFLERLLKITDAEWDRREDTLILTRGNNRVRQAIDAEIRDRTPRVAEAIKKYLEQNKQREDWSDSAVQERIKRDLEMREQLRRQIGDGASMISTMSTSSASPGTLILHEALRRIPASAFASVMPGKRLVYSTAPNPLQKALPYNAAPSIEQFIAIQNRVAAAMEAAGGNPADRRVSTDLANRGAVQRIAELIVSIQRMTDGEGFSVTAFLVDPQGDIVAQPMAWIAPVAVGAGSAPSGADQSVTLGTDSQALIALMRAGQAQTMQMGGAEVRMVFSAGAGATTSISSNSSRLPVPPGLAEKLSQPTKTDPLSWVVGELLTGLAEKTGKGLMATVPDSALGQLALASGSNSLNTKILWTQANLGLQIGGDDHGWLIHPRLFAVADRQRVDRAELERLIESSHGLDDTARYATAMSGAWGLSSLDRHWIKALAYPAFRQLDDGQRRPYLKLFGHMPANSRRPRNGSMRLAVNQLPPAARAVAEDILLGATGPMIIGEGMMTVAMEMGGGGNRPRVPAIMSRESTEAFPNGIDGRAQLEIGIEHEEVLYAVDSQGLGDFVSPRDLGFRLGVPPGTPGFSTPSYREFLIADSQRIRMQLNAGPIPRGPVYLDDWSLRKPQTKYTLDTLPARTKEQIERGKEAAKNIRIGSFTGAPPPNRPPSP
ncbi:MAG: hypothetical protein IT363_00720 [Methanoregulaceae archaeon]|nr:hypothetical protein [Methanoregulaceae archaeon]